MKKKLVIIASRSIFEFMPQDAKDYDKALLWRGISQTVGVWLIQSEVEGGLSEFLGQGASALTVEVYVKSEKNHEKL
jgi:hypothetical protein